MNIESKKPSSVEEKNDFKLSKRVTSPYQLFTPLKRLLLPTQPCTLYNFQVTSRAKFTPLKLSKNIYEYNIEKQSASYDSGYETDFIII